jgi:hypothetical protein
MLRSRSKPLNLRIAALPLMLKNQLNELAAWLQHHLRGY